MSQGKWTNAEKYVVVYPYDARFADELTVCPGDVIIFVVEEKSDSPWWLGKTRDGSGASGYFYRPFCKELLDVKCDVHYKTALMQFDGRGLHKVVYKETSYFAEEQPGDDLECLICRNLASEPHQSGCCGHTICKDASPSKAGACILTSYALRQTLSRSLGDVSPRKWPSEFGSELRQTTLTVL